MYDRHVGPIEQFRPSAWCSSTAKRIFDFVCAAILLVLVSPIMFLAAVAVKASSPGPVLFRQRRCGKDGNSFEVFKFRSMSQTASGPGLTRAGDARVTRVGRILRKWKLDELPQLVNVLRGEMSLVGPRPDLAQYFDHSTRDVRQVLALRPGVTGWASIHFRNEEELLAQAGPEQLHQFYVRQVLPLKARLDLDYAERASFLSDFGVLLRTVTAVLPATKTGKHALLKDDGDTGCGKDALS